jgi:hypothetical protein
MEEKILEKNNLDKKLLNEILEILGLKNTKVLDLKLDF